MTHAADALWHATKLEEKIAGEDEDEDAEEDGLHYKLDNELMPRWNYPGFLGPCTFSFSTWRQWRRGFHAVLKAHGMDEEHLYFHDAPLDAKTGGMIHAALTEMARVSGKGPREA